MPHIKELSKIFSEIKKELSLPEKEKVLKANYGTSEWKEIRNKLEKYFNDFRIADYDREECTKHMIIKLRKWIKEDKEAFLEHYERYEKKYPGTYDLEEKPEVRRIGPNVFEKINK
ncbi:MAG TPA: hypothetical protein PLB52_02345 [Candidatus Moranbacteria bacterium]|nr:hypothetical protein [Candidatus Moranbacteria bacterium]